MQKFIRWTQKSIIVLFVAVNATMMVFSALPDRSVLGDRILDSVARYQIFFGLEQSWSMFAPNPANMNSWVDAEIEFTDGSKEKWTFPRPSQISETERILGGERYRKYAQENLVPMERSEVWFDLSRFVARDVASIEEKGRHRIVKEVEFFKHSNFIESPDKVFIPHGELSKNFESEAVFNFKPDQKVRYEAQVHH
jgi:hypothetical protein